jgi:hypothetical protein
VTAEQPSIHSTATPRAAREEAPPVHQTQFEAAAKAKSSGGERARQVSHGPPPDQQATGPQFKRNASRSQQSATGQAAGTPPQQVADLQPARTAQEVLSGQTSPATAGKATSREHGSGRVSSSAIEEKICKQLPSSWSRLPQNACLTKKEWKQVEEELR